MKKKYMKIKEQKSHLGDIKPERFVSGLAVYRLTDIVSACGIKGKKTDSRLIERIKKR